MTMGSRIRDSHGSILSVRNPIFTDLITFILINWLVKVGVGWVVYLSLLKLSSDNNRISESMDVEASKLIRDKGLYSERHLPD